MDPVSDDARAGSSLAAMPDSTRTVSMLVRSAACGDRSAASSPVTWPTGLSAPASDCASISAAAGSRPGRHGVTAGGPVSASASKITDMRSELETPSTMQWCTFDTIAHRSSPRPSTAHISHSGRARSRRCAITRLTRLSSSSRPPGAGRPVRRR